MAGRARLLIGTVATVCAAAVFSPVPRAGARLTPAARVSAALRLPGNGRIDSLAVDAQRNVYILGNTSDPAYPTTPGALSRTCGSDAQCGATYDPFSRRRYPHPFITVLGPDGALKISTFFPGDAALEMKAIALGSDGSVYVAGNMHAIGFGVPLPFPLTKSSVPACGQFDAFVARLDATLSSLLYATCLQGPPGRDSMSIFGLAVDREGSAIVGGTANNGLRLVNALQPVNRGRPGFVAKLRASGEVAFSTFFGGSGPDIIWSVAVDPAGDIYVAGDTESRDLPLVRPFQTSLRGSTDAFVAKIDGAGRFLLYSTYLGGDSTDVVWDVAADRYGEAWVVGDSHSMNFPTTVDGVQPVSPCGSYPGCTERNPSGTLSRFDSGGRLVYSTLIGPQSVNPNAPGGARIETVFVGPQDEVSIVGNAQGNVSLVEPLTSQTCPMPCGLMMRFTQKRASRFVIDGLGVQFASRLVVDERLVWFEHAAIGPLGELYVSSWSQAAPGQQVTVIDMNGAPRWPLVSPSQRDRQPGGFSR